jgi:glycerophosphoryl diester phosphodiesterase
MPTLDALFEQCRRWGASQVRFNIETKIDPTQPALSASPDAVVRELLAVLRRHDMLGRVSLQSFDWRSLRAMHSLAPPVPTVALTAQQRWLDNVADARWTDGLKLADFGGSVPRLVKAAGVAVWSPYFGDLNPELLREARALGLRVVPWTVNEPAQIERLLDWGVDGLISDYPDRVRDALARRALPLPPALPIAP